MNMDDQVMACSILHMACHMLILRGQRVPTHACMHACAPQAVIFMFEHGESGSAGLILNRPTQFTIGTIGGLETLCPEFAENSLYMARPRSLLPIRHTLECSSLLFDAVLLDKSLRRAEVKVSNASSTCLSGLAPDSAQ
jgi:hypothetical protein